MNKILVVAGVLVSFACSAYAYKNEHVDQNHNFSDNKRIFIEFVNSPDIDNFTLGKSAQVYNDKIIKDLVPQMRQKGYYFENDYDLANRVKQETGMDYFAVRQSNPQYALRVKQAYLDKNFDAIWTFNLTSQNMEREFIQGYSLYIPTTEHAYTHRTYNTPYGQVFSNGVITYHGSRRVDVPDQYAPSSFCTVRITMVDLHKKKVVWDRIDSRHRSNSSVFSSSMPEDLFRRILASCASSAKQKFKL